jgi:hypothetical protein
MGFIFTMMMLFYTFKACEEFYKQKYPEYIFMLLFNAVMTFVSEMNSIKNF